MRDLISRQAVMDYLRGQQANVIIEKAKQNPITCDACKGMESSIEAFMNFINQVPTAYDVDKVIKQLEELTGEECTLHECGLRSERCKPCIAKKAIEIVKAGGVNE